jgi:hypothetical protein
VLPKARGLTLGTRMKVLQGPLQGQIGLLAALRPHERVIMLLQMLGGQQRVELAAERHRGGRVAAQSCDWSRVHGHALPDTFRKVRTAH